MLAINMQSLTEGENMVLGGAAAFVEAVCAHPLMQFLAM